VTADPVRVPLATTASAEGPWAVEEAVGVARMRLGARPSLVLAFPDARLETADVRGQLARAAGGAVTAGMTSDGLICGEGMRPGGCAAMAFGPGVRVGVGLAPGASRDLREAGRAAAGQALAAVDARPGHTVLLLFLDPRCGDAALAVDGAYAVAGAHVPLAGGGANGARPRVLAGPEVVADAVVAVAVRSPAPVALGMADGCAPRGAPAIATRTDGRVLREFNGRPAEDVYLEGLGLPETELPDEDFERVAVLHPLAQPELRGGLRLRHVIGRADGGGLACATPIPPNAAVWFTEQSEASIVASARRAADELRAALPGGARAALVFDCAARKAALRGAAEVEVEALLAALGPAPPVAGLYTRGEVGRTRGAKGDRNHAVVMVGFG